jgi:transcription elongation factor GreA
LRLERERTHDEIPAAGLGDVADRATNVDAHVRLAVLEERIAAVELELQSSRRHTVRSSDGTVAEGDIVTLDLGDGPETFLFGPTERATDELAVVTPGSPLGRALRGAAVGARVTYTPRPGRTLDATVVSIG